MIYSLCKEPRNLNFYIIHTIQRKIYIYGQFKDSTFNHTSNPTNQVYSYRQAEGPVSLRLTNFKANYQNIITYNKPCGLSKARAPQGLLYLRHSADKYQLIILVNFRELAHIKRIFAKPRLYRIAWAVVGLDKPVLVARIA